MNTGPVGPQGPQGTPGENWFAGTGAPAGTLATSIVGDWYLDTTTGDVYEKTGASTWTLRANIKGPQGVQGIQGIQGPIGATGPSGATAPHHVNHEVGGSDYLVNSAWLNQPNVFTKQQEIAMSGSAIILRDTTQGPDLKVFRIIGSGSQFAVGALNDALSVQGGYMTMDRNGKLTTSGGLQTANNTGNVACKDQTNVFTQPQTISYPTPALYINDPSQPADARSFRITQQGQYLYLQSLNDAGTASPGYLVVDRLGNIIITGALFEMGRPVGAGYWQNEPFNAGNFVSAGGTWVMDATSVIVSRFSLVGKTLNWYIYYSWFSGANMVSGGPTTIYSRFPGGLPGGAQNQRGSVDYAVAGGAILPPGTIDCYPDAGVHLTFAYRNGGPFPDGPFGCITHMTWEIN